MGLGKCVLWRLSYVHCRTWGSIPGLHPLDPSMPSYSCDNWKWFRTLPMPAPARPPRRATSSNLHYSPHSVLTQKYLNLCPSRQLCQGPKHRCQQRPGREPARAVKTWPPCGPINGLIKLSPWLPRRNVGPLLPDVISQDIVTYDRHIKKKKKKC